MRRGQFYVVDAFFAAVILFAGVGILVSNFFESPDQVQPQLISQDMTNTLFSTQIGDIRNTYITANYNILEETLNPISQAHLWHRNWSDGCAWCLDEAENLIQSVIESLVPEQFGSSIVLDNGTDRILFFEKNTTSEPDFRIVKTKKITSEVNESLPLLGPHVVEISVWR